MMVFPEASLSSVSWAAGKGVIREPAMVKRASRPKEAARGVVFIDSAVQDIKPLARVAYEPFSKSRGRTGRSYVDISLSARPVAFSQSYVRKEWPLVTKPPPA